MADDMFQLQLRFLKDLYPGKSFTEFFEESVHGEKSVKAFFENQSKIEEAAKRNWRENVKKSLRESESDELKLRLKNAVAQYKKNKREKNTSEREVYSNSHAGKNKSRGSRSMSKNTNVTAQKNENTVECRTRKESENLKQEESKTNQNSEVGSYGNATSDVQNLINFFFLKKIDLSEATEAKKYKDYEKQGAIPKRLFKENLNENSPQGFNKNEQLKSKGKVNPNVQKPINSSHNYEKNESQDANFSGSDFSEHDSNDDIVKLCERTCSRPFFYIVPENPSPNFLFSRGSYYVIPRHPNSSTDENIVHHPETMSGCKKIANKNFEIKGTQSSSGNGSGIRNMNDLGREVAHIVDSHLNIGPIDAKFNDYWRNLEANCEQSKSYYKTMVNPENFPKPIAIPQGVSENSETLQDESASGAMGVTQVLSGLHITHFEGAEIDNMQPPDFLTQQESPHPEQESLSNMSGLVFEPVNDNNTHLQEVLAEITAAEALKQKIENQYSILLSALPESNVEELREVCDAFQGDEELVRSYINEILRKNRQHQRLLELQSIFPDADPDYLGQELQHLGDNDEAINTLTSQLLDSKDYPKVLDAPADSGRQRLWRAYVENFSVADYIRNVPNPENFEVQDGNKNYTDLTLEFLKSRYPDMSFNELTYMMATSKKSIVEQCMSLELQGHEPVRLAKSSLKSKNFDEAFLKQVCYIDNKQEIDKYLSDLKEQKEIEVEEARFNGTFLYCSLCCNEDLVVSEIVNCAEGDIFCKDCIKRYVFVKLSEGVYKFSCPSERCETFLTYPMLEKLMPDTVLSNIIKKQQAAEISVARVDGLETCPFCEFAYIPNPEDKIFKCQNLDCLIETCRKCHEKNHIPLHCEEVERSIDVEARKKIEETMTEKLVRICPTCFKKFVKIDGCNKMTCTCGTTVCYYCRRKIEGYSHFERSGSGSGLCPLYSSNTVLHEEEVIQAGVQARNQILQQNPDVRILYDVTTSGNSD